MKDEVRHMPSDEALKRMNLAAKLASLDAMSLLAKACYEFYTSNKPLSLGFPATWNPWDIEGNIVRSIGKAMPQVQDQTIRALCQSLAVQAEKLDAVNEEWGQVLAGFLGLPTPTSENDFVALRKKLDSYRRKKGAEWTKRDEFKPLVARTKRVVVESEQVWENLHARLMEVYGDILLAPGEIGDQRAKDLIDRSYEVEAKRAIPLLERALRYGRTGLQASKAFKELGNRYEELGDLARAIENYSESIKAFRRANPITFLLRGVLYYQQGRWQEARSDLERALASGLQSPEREQAQEYLAKTKGDG